MSDLKKISKKTTLQAPKKNRVVQKKKTDVSKPANDILMLQRSVGNQAMQQLFQSEILQKKENNTGLPNNLKDGIESLSGYSMDDVKVHYNSPKPAQLNAYAYAKGSNIHLASGAEKHLPHEAWHVVQQKQGRVQTTKQLKGKVNINDDEGLEKEADVMGGRALQMREKPYGTITSKKGVEKIEGTIIHGTNNFSSIVINGLNITLNRALIMGNSYAIAVLNACEDFEKYANNKIKKLKGKVTGAELASALIEVILSIVGGATVSKLTVKVTSTLGQSIINTMSSTFQSQIKKGVKDISKGDDIKNLKEAVTLIKQGARDASTLMKKEIKKVLEPKISEIQRKVNSREELTREEDDFAAMFYLSSADTMRKNITLYLGIPDSSKSIETQIQIYQKLTEKFERKYFMATVTVQKSIYWTIKGGNHRSGADEYAYHKAREVANKRRKELEK